MPPSSNNTVGSSSSNPKKRKKEMKKRNKQRDKKEAVANKHHHKKRKHREHKESRRSSSGKRNIFGLHVYLIVLTVVSVMITSMGVYYYKKTTRSLMPPAGVLFPGTKAPSTCSEEGQQERELPTQPRVYLSHHWPLVMRLAFNFQRILTRVIESPFFPEARATRLRSRALQEMRLNDEPLQDDPPYRPFPGYAPRPRFRAVAEKHLQAQREQHRAALRAVQPLMLNGHEQDCVSPRCLSDGSFPFFRWLENQQRRLISAQSLCNFILQWGKGELELEASKLSGMHEASARQL
ncbi:hypothetical protein VYU27_004016 [Nannochloropsis oceanica]